MSTFIYNSVVKVTNLKGNMRYRFSFRTWVVDQQSDDLLYAADWIVDGIKARITF